MSLKPAWLTESFRTARATWGSSVLKIQQGRGRGREWEWIWIRRQRQASLSSRTFWSTQRALRQFSKISQKRREGRGKSERGAERKWAKREGKHKAQRIWSVILSCHWLLSQFAVSIHLSSVKHFQIYPDLQYIIITIMCHNESLMNHKKTPGTMAFHN